MVAYPDCGASNDPNFLCIYLFIYLFYLFILFIYLFWGDGSLSPPRLNIFTVGNKGVMICLGQGGLRSLSAYYYMSRLIFIILQHGTLF